MQNTKKPAISYDSRKLTDNELRLIVQTLGTSRKVDCSISMWDIENRRTRGFHLVFFTDGQLELFTDADLGEFAGSHNLMAYGDNYRRFLEAFYGQCRY